MRALVRSGLVPAKKIAAASSSARIAVCWEPTASSTASTSSAYDSQEGRGSVGSAAEGSDPRRRALWVSGSTPPPAPRDPVEILGRPAVPSWSARWRKLLGGSPCAVHG